MGKAVRALVLAGGGAKGSYQVGVYKALQELGWQPDIITGASVGSLNGVMFTMGALAQAEHLWRTMEDRDVLVMPGDANIEDLRQRLRRPWREIAGEREELRAYVLDVVRGGGLDMRPLGEVIDSIVDEDRVRASRVRFGLVMTRMEDLKSIQCPIEDIPAGSLRQYLLASSACFPALRPQEIDGVKYIDGGWRDNMPLDLAAHMGATELLGVDIDGIGVTRPNDTGLPLRVVRSHWDLGPLFDFNGERAGRNITLGYHDTLRAFGRVGGTAYALLPDREGFLPRFIEEYLRLLDFAAAKAPTLALTEGAARQLGGWPAAFTQDPTAPTYGAVAPLELAAERLEVSPEVMYAPRALAVALLASSGAEETARFAALFESEEPAVAEAALAAADPAAFVTAMACRAAGAALRQ